MDEVGLSVLAAELDADVRVIADAALTARERMQDRTIASAEAAAFHIARAYNAAEAAALRVARAFENTVRENGGWYANLMRRMTLDIPGVRPPLFGPEALETLMELREFGHAFMHAYDMRVLPERIAELIPLVERAASQMRVAVRSFIASVAEPNGWTAPVSGDG